MFRLFFIVNSSLSSRWLGRAARRLLGRLSGCVCARLTVASERAPYLAQVRAHFLQAGDHFVLLRVYARALAVKLGGLHMSLSIYAADSAVIGDAEKQQPAGRKDEHRSGSKAPGRALRRATA